MRVRISTNPPLPPLKAWLPLSQERTPTISALKVFLSASVSAFRNCTPSLLRLSIDGFELLDNSEISVVRDGDLICVDAHETCSSESTTRALSLAGHKRKRRVSTSTSGFESDTESTTSSSESSSDTDSDSDSDSSRPTTPPQKITKHVALAQPKPNATHPNTTFVPPGYGKQQTRSRNLRRRRKRMHAREAASVPEGEPVSGANAISPDENTQVQTTMSDAVPVLPSLSLRNKNKARNFKSLMGKPLPPKIIFQEDTSTAADTVSKSSTQASPRLVPPSSRASLPPNVFVTSVDVEAGKPGKKRQMRVDYGEEESGDMSLDYGNATSEMDVDGLEATAEKQWATLERLARERRVAPGTVVGYKALGISPVTYTPEEMLTVARVESCDDEAVVVRTLRGREQVSFSGPADDSVAVQEEERHTWEEMEDADWRILG